ncbi:sterol desaturase family protein [Aestuariirhabdus sp. Z084]|uniref:sterol desaturase family protein n=1 Tax=Aestuariirhabdus haliotis TaxID=2918751 RepID=UPI00201B3CA0|nr:sterol desaturase family protein [Aestuariirhabdus haliotis]MCL6414351.1 sterol desaturase family protein [Aestuariirhabdus haliotis]MCL6418283.1 sterol desaturase family protein [Aestuariirhabdus haliotis]
MNTDAPMNYIVYAIPVFFGLILIELIAGWLRQRDYYRINDGINSLSAGMFSITSGVLSKTLTLAIYLLAYEQFSLAQWNSDSLWLWLAAFVAYDFCYYWAHRLGHEINILWAAHSVHHQSEEYNLTTALRQTSSGFVFGWIFFLPMALAGVPPLVFAVVAAANLLYQFWVHTRHIPKLGWLEWIFVTPSNHRVHHAQNSRYLDRNYGGVFIIWDRLLGTFAEESDEEKIIYGVRKPLASWNPLWANLQHYVQMLQDARHATRWQDRLSIWVRPTGWRPADVAERYPLKRTDLDNFTPFDTRIPSALTVYLMFQFLVMIVFTTWIMAVSHLHPLWFTGLLTALQGYSLFCIGYMLEGREGFVKHEKWRMALSAASAVLLVALDQLSFSTTEWIWLLGYFVLSSAWLTRLERGLSLQALASAAE